jgi:lipoprotein signal peptidase
MSERSYRGLLWSLVLIGATLDQSSKYSVFRWLYHNGQGGQQEIIPGAFEFRAEFAKIDDSDRPALAEPADVPSGSSDNVLGTLRTWSGDKPPRVNHGALFGFLGKYTTLANGLFAMVSLLAALAIAYWSTRPATSRDRYLCAALGLILAGTLGNLYDRLVFNGVRDFLHFYLIEWPVFNVADCCLVCGAFLLLAQAFWSQPATAERQVAQVTLSPEAAEVQ